MQPSVQPVARDPFAGLRGIMAWWILAGHMLLHERYSSIYDAGFAQHEDFGALSQLSILHFLSVDLFFMLSGLVLTLHYFTYFTQDMKGRAIDRFYWRRLTRLWPMHAVMVGVIGLFAVLNIPHPISSHFEGQIFAHWQWTLALNLLFMNAWGIIPVASWNEPAWSLSILFFLSVLFPNLLLGLKRLPERPKLYAVLIAVLLIGFALLRPIIATSSYSDGSGALVRGLVFFTVGCLLALYIRAGGRGLPHAGRWVPITFVGMVILWTYGTQFPLTFFHLAYPVLLLTLFQGIKPILPLRLAQWIGSRSFALFMTHYPALLAIRYFMGPLFTDLAATSVLGKIASYAVVLLLVLLATEAAYRLLDRPRRINVG